MFLEDFESNEYNEFDYAKEESESIEYCLNCGSLHLIEDELGSVVCKSCGCENYTAIAPNIDVYLEMKEKNKL